MRWIENIPNKDYTINLYHHQERYILKFEAGPMEQTYKIPQNLKGDASSVKELLTPDFLEGIRQQFNTMYLLLKTELDRS